MVCARNNLRDNGITLSVDAAEYYQGTASGGRQDAFLFGGRADYLLDIDGQKAGLWQGLFINLHGESVYGDSVNNLTGAAMPVNTGRVVPIPDGQVTALTGVKVTQALSENFAVFGGKLNMFDSFNEPFLPGRGLDNGFMNLAAIVNPVIARTVPYSTWGAGAALIVDGKPAGAVMVLDTNNTPTTTGFETFFDNGATILATGGLPSNFFGMPGVHSFLGTYSSGRDADTDTEAYTIIGRILLGLPPLKQTSGSWSLTYNLQQTLWIDPCDKNRTFGLFGSAGIADSNPNPIPWCVTAGMAGTAPLASRIGDTFGVCYYYMGLSSEIKDIAPLLLPLRDEQGVELFYNVQVTPWFHLTPDLQVISGIFERTDTSVVVGVRAKIDF